MVIVVVMTVVVVPAAMRVDVDPVLADADGEPTAPMVVVMAAVMVMIAMVLMAVAMMMIAITGKAGRCETRNRNDG